MQPNELRQKLRQAALKYAAANSISVDISHKSAVVFRDLSDAFCPATYKAIRSNPSWLARINKTHQNVSGVKEMQSSNSSDALLMNIFCHPKLSTWKGIARILGFTPSTPVFGFMPRIKKGVFGVDKTEIDMAISGYFVEAKLTETSFTRKAVANVQKYAGLSKYFDTRSLAVHQGAYRNYQVIRNLLAAIQHGRHHLLLCDERRQDLVREYFKTVCSLRYQKHRSRCHVIYWQEIQRASGKDLKLFLQARYGFY